MSRWPWHDPDPVPEVTRVEEAEALRRLARIRRMQTLAALRRRARDVAQNNFADDVKEALGV